MSRLTRLICGFTLIKLLVAIAIIAILAPLLLPALSAAESKAQSIKCVSYVRQIVVAYKLYVIDYNDFFPIHGGYLDQGGNTGIFSAAPYAAALGSMTPMTNTAKQTRKRTSLRVPR